MANRVVLNVAVNVGEPATANTAPPFPSQNAAAPTGSSQDTAAPTRSSQSPSSPDADTATPNPVLELLRKEIEDLTLALDNERTQHEGTRARLVAANTHVRYHASEPFESARESHHY